MSDKRSRQKLRRRAALEIAKRAVGSMERTTSPLTFLEPDRLDRYAVWDLLPLAATHSEVVSTPRATAQHFLASCIHDLIFKSQTRSVIPICFLFESRMPIEICLSVYRFEAFLGILRLASPIVVHFEEQGLRPRLCADFSSEGAEEVVDEAKVSRLADRVVFDNLGRKKARYEGSLPPCSTSGFLVGRRRQEMH